MRANSSGNADWLGGFIADLPTPFTDDDKIDHIAFARLCERQVCAGATAILVGDTAGEMTSLTPDERAALIRTAVAIAGTRTRVVAGAGSNATETAIELTRLAANAGADAVISITPYYNRPTQEGIEDHFRAIAASTALPIVLHDSPARTARALSDDTLVRLMGSPRIVGLRDDTGDATRLTRLRPRLPVGARLLMGNDTTALPYLVLGGDGAISGIANIAPQLCRGIVAACRQGQVRYAATIMEMLTPLAMALPQDLMPSAAKYALSLRGLVRPDVRLPLVELGEVEKGLISAALERIWAMPETSALRWQRA